MYLVRSGALQGFEALVARFGANPAALLAEQGLSSALLRQPDAYLAYPRVAELMERAAESCDYPWFGFELSRLQRHSVLGELVLRAAQEPTRAAAIEVMLRHVHLHASGISTLQRSSPGSSARQQVAIAFEFKSPRGTLQLMQLSLGVLHRSLMDLCGGQNDDYEVWVTQPVGMDGRHGEQPFGHPPVLFSKEVNAVEFPAAWMEAAPLRDEEHLSQHLQRQLDYLESVYPNDLLLQLRYSISNLLPSGECSLDRCAAALGLHPRLLQKRLQRQGLSFGQVLRESREQIALQHLQNSSISLTDLALNLGFAELSVFSRSFKRWQGVSPQGWRKRWREGRG
ncbi:AraC family transcriptional regulator ligand-binding domain-containing protein [Aestuariirhabdus sp. LZHN29]|uniref:AraC family transcriptional regulator n=1 Tax=Aestuariirhabdus sp. LZHN29 TaxID=3417462 RepID=UPI003CFA3609